MPHPNHARQQHHMLQPHSRDSKQKEPSSAQGAGRVREGDCMRPLHISHVMHVVVGARAVPGPVQADCGMHAARRPKPATCCHSSNSSDSSRVCMLILVLSKINGNV